MAKKNEVKPIESTENLASEAVEEGSIIPDHVDIEKALDVTNTEDAKNKISDIKVVGDCDSFKLLCKASSESQGFMKSTKVCNVNGGCIVQVSTQQKNPDGSYSLAEAITFVPGNHLREGKLQRM